AVVPFRRRSAANVVLTSPGSRMSASPRDELRDPARLGDAVTQPFPGSAKLHVSGSRADLRVAMREIRQSTTPGVAGPEANPPIVVYDTSGPYTDPDYEVDLLAGLPARRAGWIEERADSAALAGRTSSFARARAGDAELAALTFPACRVRRRALPGGNVTQMHYARRGIVTPEMEYVALRENACLDERREAYAAAGLLARHPGTPFGARLPERVTP